MNDQKAISDEIANRSAAVKLPQIKADVVALIEVCFMWLPSPLNVTENSVTVWYCGV